jgi:hypothetical protein
MPEQLPIGPIELLVVKFPGNQFKGEIAPALRDLVESRTITVIDILFAFKDENGEVAMFEINDLDDDDFAVFDPVVSDITGLLGPDDIKAIAELLPNDSSAAIMLFENTWATRFVQTLENANAELVLSERIPRSIIREVVALKEQEEAEAPA